MPCNPKNGRIVLKSIVTLCLLLLSLPLMADDDSSSPVEAQIRAHGGVQLIDIPDTVESFDAFYVEANTQANLRQWPALYGTLDARGETLAATYGANERTAWYAHLRPGVGFNTPLISNFSVYAEAKTSFTAQWFRLNGSLEEDSPATYQTQLYESGVVDRYRGALWRLGVAWDGSEAEADRTPWQARGHVHVQDDRSDSPIAWGVNGRISPDYMSLGLSLRIW